MVDDDIRPFREWQCYYGLQYNLMSLGYKKYMINPGFDLFILYKCARKFIRSSSCPPHSES